MELEVDYIRIRKTLLDMDISLADKLVLAYIESFKSTVATNSQISRELNLSERTVRRSLEVLTKRRLVSVSNQGKKRLISVAQKVDKMSTSEGGQNVRSRWTKCPHKVDKMSDSTSTSNINNNISSNDTDTDTLKYTSNNNINNNSKKRESILIDARTHAKINTLLSKLATIYPGKTKNMTKKEKQELAIVWAEIFKDEPEEDLERAYLSYIRKSRYFPLPSEFKAELELVRLLKIQKSEDPEEEESPEQEEGLEDLLAYVNQIEGGNQ